MTCPDPALLRIHHAWARVTAPDDWVMRGGSAVIGPDGAYLAGPLFDEARTLHATLDLSQVRAESMTLDVSGHYHRPDCFEFRVKAADPPRRAPRSG